MSVPIRFWYHYCWTNGAFFVTFVLLFWLVSCSWFVSFFFFELSPPAARVQALTACVVRFLRSQRSHYFDFLVATPSAPYNYNSNPGIAFLNTALPPPITGTECFERFTETPSQQPPPRVSVAFQRNIFAQHNVCSAYSFCAFGKYILKTQVVDSFIERIETVLHI